MCGEQSRTYSNTDDVDGSPPRVRGTEFEQKADNIACRITPACAGNSATLRWCSGIDWDHPRVCGEQLKTHKDDVFGIGSPPRVRGTVTVLVVDVALARITPACAGNRVFNGL